jgi:Secretion system C-terminal sorting domain
MIKHVYLILLLCLNVGLAFAQSGVYLFPGSNLTIQTGGNVIIKGSTYLSNGASLVNSGTIHVSNSSLTNWTDSSYINGSLQGNGKIYFEGTAPVNFSGATNFYDLVLNGSKIILDSPSTFGVSHQLFLQNGIIKTNKSILKIGNESADAIVNDLTNVNYSKSWIEGKLNRRLASSNFSYEYPVGDSVNVHLLTLISNNLTGINDATVFFGAKNGNDAGLTAYEGFAYTTIHNAGVWYLSSNAEPTGGNFNLRLSINGFEGLTDNHFSILSRPASSNDGADWIVPPGSNLPPNGNEGRTVLSGFTQRNFLANSFNQQFGIGLLSAPLPVNLINFNGKRINGNTVQLDWSTLTENNNNGFVIERQNKNSGYTALGFVSTKATGGNSSGKLHYSFADNTATAELSFYRLKQMNIAGSFVYSAIILIAGENTSTSLFPNPSKGVVYIHLPVSGAYQLLVSSADGKLIKKGNLFNTRIDLSKLAGGYYTITIMDEKNRVLLSEKILLLKD